MNFNKIITIHGVPRSGTSWLGSIFDSSPEVIYKFQPLFSYAFKDRINLQSTKKEIEVFFQKLYSCKDDFICQQDKIEKGICPNFKIKHERPPVLVFKHVRYHYLIPYFLELFDNIKVIGIVRNPCAVLNSWHLAPKEFLPEWNFLEEWRFGQKKNKFRPEEYYGFHRWKEATKLFLEMQKKFSNKFCFIRYENLVKNLPLEVYKLFKYCKLKVTPQTKKFLKDTQLKNIDDSYSVFKGEKDIFEWKKKLNKDIVNAIYKELSGTEFEQFIS